MVPGRLRGVTPENVLSLSLICALALANLVRMTKPSCDSICLVFCFDVCGKNKDRRAHAFFQKFYFAVISAFSPASTVCAISVAIVIGPTPPGTGVYAEQRSTTAAS